MNMYICLTAGHRNVTSIELVCPGCEGEVLYNPTAPLEGSNEKTISCRNCGSYVAFEYSIRVVEDRPMYRERDWLYEQYVIKKKSMAAVGKMCGVSAMTIRGWIQNHGIQARSRGQKPD